VRAAAGRRRGRRLLVDARAGLPRGHLRGLLGHGLGEEDARALEERPGVLEHLLAGADVKTLLVRADTNVKCC
jgi:hypothetical protein